MAKLERKDRKFKFETLQCKSNQMRKHLVAFALFNG